VTSTYLVFGHLRRAALGLIADLHRRIDLDGGGGEKHMTANFVQRVYADSGVEHYFTVDLLYLFFPSIRSTA
jgi:hypothetical protein